MPVDPTYKVISTHVSPANKESFIITGISELEVKKLKSLNKYEPRKQKEKLFMFLASKGFKYDIVKQAIDKIYND